MTQNKAYPKGSYSGISAAEARGGARQADYQKIDAQRQRTAAHYDALNSGGYREHYAPAKPRANLSSTVGVSRLNPLMPYGVNAPVAQVSTPTGAPVGAAEYWRHGGVIDGEYKLLSSKPIGMAQWMRRALAALKLAGRLSPFGRLLDAITLADLLYDLWQAHEGGALVVDEGWGNYLQCNFPPISSSRRVTTVPGTSPISCFQFQAITYPQFSTNHRNLIEWEQANAPGTRWDMYRRWYYAGTLPNPGFPSTSLPVNLPVNTINLSSLDPMSNPITAPVGTPVPVPYPLRATRPNTPWYEQSYGRPENQPLSRTQTEVVVVMPPNGPPTIVKRPMRDAQPSNNVKERKFKLTGAAARAMRIVGTITEAGDVLDCLHGALPPKLQAKPTRRESPGIVGGAYGANKFTGKGDWNPPSPQAKAQAVWKYTDKVDAVAFGRCILINHVQDAVIGRVSQKIRSHDPTRPIGWLAGPAL